ncbi:MAG: hypothetical protein ABIK08_11695, partial [Pseudomonadota bacterium]
RRGCVRAACEISMANCCFDRRVSTLESKSAKTKPRLRKKTEFVSKLRPALQAFCFDGSG